MKLLAVRVVLVLAIVPAIAFLLAAAAAGPAAALSTGNGGWKWQNPLPHGTAYQGAYFTTPTKGWLITDGCILRTTNGGVTVKVQADHNVRLKDITFVNARRGWAVGWPAAATGRVIVYRTTNGGASWQRIPIDIKGRLNAVAFANKNVGWAVGSRPGDYNMTALILKTVDGGLTWSRQPVRSVAELNDIDVLNARRGWVVGGDGRVRGTTNGGGRWKVVGTDMSEDLVAVDFKTRLVGWLAGWERVWRTDDGGATWTVQLAPGMGARPNRDLAFADQSNGWVAGGNGSISTTTDGGTHWVQRDASSDIAFSCVSVVSPTAAVIGGEGGRLGRSLDNGATWTWQPQAAGGYGGWCSSVDFVDAANGWISAASTPFGPGLPAGAAIMHSADGGVTWALQDPSTAQPLLDIDFTDVNNGWAVGAGGVIVHTANGGGAWGPQLSGTAADLKSVFFADSRSGWAVGDDFDYSAMTGGGIVRRTLDGGVTWTPQTSPDFAYCSFWEVAFADAQHGWMVGTSAGDDMGEPAVIFGTSDGGANWTRQLSYVPPVSHSIGRAALWSIAAIDASKAVAVGYADDNDAMLPLVFRTVNGGATWTRGTVPTSWDAYNIGLFAVAFSGAAKGWAVGSDGIMLRTTNGGRNWKKVRTGVAGDLNGVCFVTGRRGWAVGDFAAILRTTTGGLAP